MKKSNATKFKKLIWKHRLSVMVLISILLIVVLTALDKGAFLGVLLLLVVVVLRFIKVFIKKKSKNKNIVKKDHKKINNNTKKKNNVIEKKVEPVKKSKKVNKGALKIGLIVLLTLFLVFLLGVVYFFTLVVSGAPEFNPDNLYNKEASILYDKDGEVIAKIGEEIRQKIDYDDMPQVLVDAIIATEDARFFQHNGFDLPRFLRASSGQAVGNTSAGGGSTLTMQLSKNMFTSTVSTGFEGIVRKFTDIYVSIFELEKVYTKFEIIEFYANSNFMGSNSYGVEQASQTYFGKSAKDLNLSEAALIAGLFQAPSAYDPNVHPDKAEERRNIVLSLMERHGYITNEERKIAAAIKVEDMLYESEVADIDFLAFINTVTKEVEDRTGNNPYVVPMDIYTTMDREKQTHLDAIFSGETYEWENEVVQGATVAVDVETGAIAAIGAGRNQSSRRTYNYATMTNRHIGSTSKPIYDYGPAVEFNNWSTYQPIIDEPTSYSTGTSVNNWDRKYDGFITMRDALTRSRNTTALKTFQSVKNSDIKTFTTDLGLSPENEGNIVHEAHSLGGYTGESPLSLSVAYAAFANGGYYVEPHSFTKIVYKETDEVYEVQTNKIRVMSDATAYIIANVLVDAGRWGLGNNYSVNGVAYGAKTGTSNFTEQIKRDFGLGSNAIRDLWVASTSPKYAVSVWYGYDEINSEFYTRFGSREHRRLFQEVAKGIYTENPGFKRPSSVKEVAVERGSFPAKLPSENTPSNMIIRELFKDGTEPTEVSTRYAKLQAPTDLEFNESGGAVTLSWTPISTPLEYDADALRTNFQILFRNENYLDSFITSRINSNKETLGDFGYNVYVVNGDQEQFLGFTTTNSFQLSTYPVGTKTYIVRAAYSKFNSAISNPLSKSFEGQAAPVANSILNVSETIILPVGETYFEPENPVTVFSDGENVTEDAKITITYKNEMNETVLSIDSISPQTYTVIYNISYKSYRGELKRTIIIE